VRSAVTEVGPGPQQSSGEGLVDKGFSMDLPLELILRDEEELNRPRRGDSLGQGLFETPGGLMWLK